MQLLWCGMFNVPRWPAQVSFIQYATTTSLLQLQDEFRSIAAVVKASRLHLTMVNAGITTLCLLVVIVLNFNLILSLRLHSLSSATIQYPRNPAREREKTTVSKGRRSLALLCVNADDQKNAVITLSDADLMAKITAAAEDNVFMRYYIWLSFRFLIWSPWRKQKSQYFLIIKCIQLFSPDGVLRMIRYYTMEPRLRYR